MGKNPIPRSPFLRVGPPPKADPGSLRLLRDQALHCRLKRRAHLHRSPPSFWLGGSRGAQPRRAHADSPGVDALKRHRLGVLHDHVARHGNIGRSRDLHPTSPPSAVERAAASGPPRNALSAWALQRRGPIPPAFSNGSGSAPRNGCVRPLGVLRDHVAQADMRRLPDGHATSPPFLFGAPRSPVSRGDRQC